MPQDNTTHKDLAELLLASRNGNEQALAQIAKALHTSAVSFFRVKKLSRDLIDELAQNSLESILRSLDKVNKPDSLESFAYKLYIRQWQNYLESKKGRLEQFENDIDELYESEIKLNFPIRDSDGNLNPLYDNDGRFDFIALLNDLPQVYREAVLLKFFEQLSYEEISEDLDISMDTARKRVSRGISIIRTIIK